MKKKFITFFIFGFILFTGINFITACEKDKHKQESIEHEHVFTNYISDNNATCTEDGTKTAKCDIEGCDHTHTVIDLNTALGHSFTTYISNHDATFFSDGTKTAECDRENCNHTHTIRDIDSKLMTELPIFSISTKNMVNITDKENYIECEVSISNTDYEYEFSNLTGKIKGRGNSTWSAPKKPYKLKFDKKVDLFGNGAAKTWTILANYYDQSLIRNYLAFGVGSLFESQEMCTSTHFVNLIVNNEFYGIYLVAEEIEVADTRVEIDENYNNLDTGYLIEMDGRAPSEGVLNKDYFQINNVNYAIKSPDTEDEDFTIEHVNYIKSYMDDVMHYLTEEKDWEALNQLIDVTSFAENYIVEELFHNADVAFSSFYMYKVENDKLFAGPLWDFDLSSGFYFGEISSNFYNTEQHYACLINPWYIGLIRYDEFKALVGEILSNKYKSISNEITNRVNLVLSLKDSFLKEFIIWQESSTGWENEVITLKEWLLDSLEFLKNDYSVYINK